MQIRIIVITSFVLFIVGGCNESSPVTAAAESSPEFAGSLACRNCHTSEYDLWQNSHHALAMQVANDDTVLGDFSNISYDYFDTTTYFIKHADEFVVRTENAQGKIQDFPVTHTFGVEPLQQYLVDFPGGRKQALPFAWDTRSSESGGQRWYHLYPDEYVTPADPLHWTGRYFNWNYMCAECHSTNVDLSYNIEANSFNTTFSEISVSCEACHGPGSAHVTQANDGAFDQLLGLSVDLDDRKNADWVINSDTGIAERSSPNLHRQQPESCGRCHARRSVIAKNYEYGKPLADTHSVSLLAENLYHADGRIQDEVYVYGSFAQSKMYAAGVTCSDCHNPHSGQLHAGPNPNDTCAQCHLPTRFATTDHSADKAGNCVSCHMPATFYMGVDDRRDHSFRLPGTEADPSHYGSAIAAGRTGRANAALLTGIANNAFPAIARATMLTLLEPIQTEEAISALIYQFNDPDPLVRIAALRAVRTQPPEVRLRSGSQLLRDPVRGVRIEAAETYVDYRDLLPAQNARAFPSAANEFRQAMLSAASTPDAAFNLAEFESRMSNTESALKLYRHVLRIDEAFAPGQHGFGLLLVRNGQAEAALQHLRRATELAPDDSRYVYVYGVALNSLGHSDEAVRVLEAAHTKFKNDYDIGWGLATMLRDQGRRDEARVVANKLVLANPDADAPRQLLESL